jgi:hypothetical protein
LAEFGVKFDPESKMKEASCFVINKRLASEQFENEIILIDVERGLYYSLQGACIDLWQAFASEQVADHVVEAFCARVPVADRGLLQQAIGHMCANNILVRAADRTTSESQIILNSIAFVAPVIEVYSDLADLIAIDPVHEVDATAGWPLRPPNFPDVG